MHSGQAYNEQNGWQRIVTDHANSNKSNREHAEDSEIPRRNGQTDRPTCGPCLRSKAPESKCSRQAGTGKPARLLPDVLPGHLSHRGIACQLVRFRNSLDGNNLIDVSLPVLQTLRRPDLPPLDNLLVKHGIVGQQQCVSTVSCHQQRSAKNHGVADRPGCHGEQDRDCNQNAAAKCLPSGWHFRFFPDDSNQKATTGECPKSPERWPTQNSQAEHDSRQNGIASRPCSRNDNQKQSHQKSHQCFSHRMAGVKQQQRVHRDRNCRE